jgi:hypothetical protein
MTDKKLSVRQMEALEAVLYGQSPRYQKAGVYSSVHPKAGQPYWRARTSMGGAVSRMIETLEQEGYLLQSARSRISDELDLRWSEVPELPEDLHQDRGGLSEKGLLALDAMLRSPRRFDPTDGRLNMVRDQLAKRRALASSYQAFMSSRKDAQKERFERDQQARRLGVVFQTKRILAEYGFDVNGLTDDQVAKLAKSIAGAEHSLVYVRFLNDADLSALLDETQKQAVTPGTIGDSMRSEKLTAIRAEFERRQKAAA